MKNAPYNPYSDPVCGPSKDEYNRSRARFSSHFKCQIVMYALSNPITILQLLLEAPAMGGALFLTKKCQMTGRSDCEQEEEEEENEVEFEFQFTSGARSTLKISYMKTFLLIISYFCHSLFQTLTKDEM